MRLCTIKASLNIAPVDGIKTLSCSELSVLVTGDVDILRHTGAILRLHSLAKGITIICACTIRLTPKQLVNAVSVKIETEHQIPTEGNQPHKGSVGAEKKPTILISWQLHLNPNSFNLSQTNVITLSIFYGDRNYG